jgi:type III pantothenate kinase
MDFGTATTFDVVSDQGEFLGGAIAPGIMISTEALFRAAAALPRIDIIRPRSAIGRNTVSNMQAGIVFGFAGQVDGIVHRIHRELGQRTPVIATGGLASLVAEECETVTEVDPFLTLTGLRLIYERNPRSGRGAVDAGARQA